MANQVTEIRPYVPAKTVSSEFPLIDSDPHIKRVIRYARPYDYGLGLAGFALGPTLMTMWEKFAPSYVGRGGFPPIMRLSLAIGAGGGFFMFYQSSILRFYGFKENQREIDMDMREMVDKVKRKEPLYGTSTLTPYMQGVAARNSRYSGLFIHVLPWFNFVNHDLHGVDTAKYYQQAERELEAERLAKKNSG